MLKALFCSLITCLPVHHSHAGDFENYEELQALIASLEKEAIYPRGELASIFAEVKRQNKALEAMTRPAESTKEWKDYRTQFLTNDRINRGLDFWDKYQEPLNKAEAQYGVPTEVILAIIGVETKFGGNKGSFRVVDTLASLAFDFPRRSTFFRQELKNFLILSKEQGLTPLDVYGSYAGAMGYPQFMPSSWRNLAVDFDGDNKIDLLNNPVDAIGSVANYFKSNGWKTNEAIATRAKIIADNYDEAITSKDLKTASTLADIKSKGLDVKEGAFASTMPASALRLQGENGAEFWLAFNNFYVITTYNRSTLYAMAVMQLSQALKEARAQVNSSQSLVPIIEETPVTSPEAPTSPTT
jgi:membrane-bound lytic murein transglycosylase B